jgi:hypothetical protein
MIALSGFVRSPTSRRWLALPLVAFLLAMTTSGCGCGKKTAVVPTTVPATSTTTAPGTAPSANSIPPIVLSASGTSTTNAFSLIKGLTVFQLTYTGGGNLQVNLLSQSGEQVSTLFNTNTNIIGSTAIGITGGGYSLSVNGMGPWQVVVNQAVPVNPQFLPLDLNGTGPLVTPFFQSGGGNATVSMTYSGSQPFVVTMLNANGGSVSQLADQQSGPFTGAQSVQLSEGAAYLIDVEAVGAWTLSVR